MCVLFYSSSFCISAYANVYFKTTIIKQNITLKTPVARSIFRPLSLTVGKVFLGRRSWPQLQLSDESPQNVARVFSPSPRWCLVNTWNLMVSSSPHCQVLRKSIHAVLFMQPHTSVPIFPGVIMPSTPTPPTINLQLFLDSLMFWWKFSLFLVHFSIEKSKETKK